MKNITVALLLGLFASALSYAVLNTSLALSFFFNPFIPYYFDFDTTNESILWPAIMVGFINMIPFFCFGILSIHMLKSKTRQWLFGTLILLYLGWIVSHFF